MKGSSEASLSSSSSQSKKENEFDVDIDEEEEEEEKGDEELVDKEEEPSSKNGGVVSSSSSTIEENEKSKGATGGGGSVRQYVRSKNSRLRWTPDLHLRFIHAVERIGGQERATPKLVLQLMNVKGLNIAHVKSHLQMFRSKKIEDPNQDQGFYNEGGDNHVYNLTQISMIQSLNHQWPSSSLSYGADAFWRCRRDNHRQMFSPYNRAHQLHDHHNARASGLYGSVSARLFGSNNTTTTTPNPIQLHTNHIQSPWRPRHQIHNELQPFNTLKRKALDSLDDDASDLDLNLSLKVPTITQEKELGFGLSLSLFPSSSSSSSSSKKQEGNNGRSASTLELTL